MKSLFSFIKPQIAFGAGGGGGGRGKGSTLIKPTGFADQASRMANSQRQLGAPQMPGFNLEADKDVPSVAKRKSSRDNSPIDTGSGGFLGGFQKSPKSGSGGGSSYGSNPLNSGFSTDRSKKEERLDLSGIGGVTNVDKPKMPEPLKEAPGKTATDPVGTRPKMPRVIADDFIPRNPDGSPKYTAPDGSPLRRPYNPSTPSRPTPRPGGGKGGGGIARPPKREPIGGPAPTPPSRPDRPTMPVMPTPFPDPRPRRPSTPISDPREPMLPERPERPITAPQPRITPRDGGKGGGGLDPRLIPGMQPRIPSRPTTPVLDIPRQRPTAPVPQKPRQPIVFDDDKPLGAPDPVDPMQQIAIGLQQQQLPTGPRRYAPGTAGGSYQMMGGGKGGGARPPMQQRRPQMPFTYYRPRR